MCAAFTAVAARLAIVQTSSGRPFVALGEQQLVHDITLPADRGTMFDRNGNDLALTINVSTVWADPHQVTDPRGEAERLAPILGMDVDGLQQRLSANAGFVYLSRKVTDDVAQQVKTLALPGVQLMDEPQRFLPAGDLAAPVLGRVGMDNEGLGGLEQQYENRLEGKPGHVRLERDPRGQEIPGGRREFEPAARGDDLVLTLDRSLQFETEQALSAEIVAAHAKGGIAAVMQSDTGEILALANLSRDGEGDGAPVVPAASNTALTNVYEPGSVNKLVTISGALEEGLVQPTDQFLIGDSMKVNDAIFHDNEPHPKQNWSVTDIVANSSNIGTITIGQKLGKDKIDHYLHAYGFGKRTDLSFPGESAGLLLPPDKWSGTSLATISIGQGVAVTGLQMLGAYNTIANGGVYVAPKLVKATVDDNGHQHATPPSERRRVVSEKTSDEMTAMLGEVVRVGTAKLAAIDGYTVAGKTGTARKPMEGGRGYKQGAYVSTFAGFVPAEHPALTAIVVLDEPTPIYGGLVSAPVFAEIARYALREFRVPPPPANTTIAHVPAADPAAANASGEADVPDTSPTTQPGMATAKPAPQKAPAPGGQPSSPPTTGASTPPSTAPPRKPGR